MTRGIIQVRTAARFLALTFGLSLPLARAVEPLPIAAGTLATGITVTATINPFDTGKTLSAGQVFLESDTQIGCRTRLGFLGGPGQPIRVLASPRIDAVTGGPNDPCATTGTPSLTQTRIVNLSAELMDGTGAIPPGTYTGSLPLKTPKDAGFTLTLNVRYHWVWALGAIVIGLLLGGLYRSLAETYNPGLALVARTRQIEADTLEFARSLTDVNVSNGKYFADEAKQQSLGKEAAAIATEWRKSFTTLVSEKANGIEGKLWRRPLRAFNNEEWEKASDELGQLASSLERAAVAKAWLLTGFDGVDPPLTAMTKLNTSLENATDVSGDAATFKTAKTFNVTELKDEATLTDLAERAKTLRPQVLTWLEFAAKASTKISLLRTDEQKAAFRTFVLTLWGSKIDRAQLDTAWGDVLRIIPNDVKMLVQGLNLDTTLMVDPTTYLKAVKNRARALQRGSAVLGIGLFVATAIAAAITGLEATYVPKLVYGWLDLWQSLAWGFAAKLLVDNAVGLLTPWLRSVLSVTTA